MVFLSYPHSSQHLPLPLPLSTNRSQMPAWGSALAAVTTIIVPDPGSLQSCLAHHLALSLILDCPVFYFPEYPPNLEEDSRKSSLPQTGGPCRRKRKGERDGAHIQERPNTLEDPADPEL